MVDLVLRELADGWPDREQLVRVLVRLVAAAFLGGLIGFQRERAGKAAGLRTHMLVAVGSAVFVVACFESGFSDDDLSRVIQGLATGIGFIGAGAILKFTEEREITGLTTAASIWMAAAIGVTAGLGRWGSATVSVVLTLIILATMVRIEKWYRTVWPPLPNSHVSSCPPQHGKAEPRPEKD
jgi:putative Mg2+ transporter-C (MgtC) family protein